MQRGSGFPQRRRHLWPEAKSEVDFEKEATFDAHFRAPYEPPPPKRARLKYEDRSDSSRLDALVFYAEPAAAAPPRRPRRPGAAAPPANDEIANVLGWAGPGAPEPNNDHLHIHPPSQLAPGDLNPLRPDAPHGRKHFAPDREGARTPRAEGLGRGAGRPAGDGLYASDEGMIARNGGDFWEQPTMIRIHEGQSDSHFGSSMVPAVTPGESHKRAARHPPGCLRGAGAGYEDDSLERAVHRETVSMKRSTQIGGLVFHRERPNPDARSGQIGRGMVPTEHQPDELRAIAARMRPPGHARRTSFQAANPSAVLAVPPTPMRGAAQNDAVRSSLRFGEDGLMSDRPDEAGGGRRAGGHRSLARVALESLQHSGPALAARRADDRAADDYDGAFTQVAARNSAKRGTQVGGLLR